MHIESFREYCLAKKAVTEGMPFGETVLVFKVAGKMFALAALDSDPFQVNLKCDPERAVKLRDEYEDIIPGYHKNKQHWNSVIIGNGRLPDKLVKELIDHSYDLIVDSLSKKQREEMGGKQ